MPIDRSTVIGWGLDELSKLGAEFRKFIFSDKGIALISGIFTGTGLGAAISTKKGRESVSKAWTTVKTTISKSAKEGTIKSVKGFAGKVAKAVATKLAHGAGAVSAAIIAGYVTGLTLGDYFKSDAKNFWQQFGQDLALNLAAGPIASAVKHVIVNRDMVADDIKNKVIKPIGKELKKFGQWIGIIPKDDKSSTGSEPDSSTPKGLAPNGGVPVDSGAYTEKRRREIEEYEKGKKSQPSKTTSDQVVEFMSKIKKNGKPAEFNAPTWYWQGLAAKLMSTVLTWTSLKQYNADYRFVSNCAIRVGLTLPVQKNVLHTQVKSNINILWQSLRGKNTGAFNYSEGDVYAYQFGISALIARHRYLVKLLNLGNKYDPEVTTQPECLYDSIFSTRGKIIRQEVTNNKPSYCERLNTIAKTLNTYALKGNTLISRWNYLADKCISDYNGPKAVKAVYKLEFFPELNMSFDGSTDTRELKYVSINYGTATINSLISDLEAAVDNIRLWHNSVLLKVAGDMIKLLGASAETFANTFYINGSEVPDFKYDAEANDQLRNGKMFEPDFSDVTKFLAPGYYSGIEVLGGSVGFVSSSHTTDFANWSYLKPEWLVTSDRNKVFNNAENLQLIQFGNVQVKSSAGVVQGTSIYCEEHGTSILIGFTITGYDPSNNPLSQEIKSIITFDSACDLQYNGQGINLTVSQFNMLLQIDFMPSPEQVSMNGNGLNWYGRWLDVDDYAYMTDLQYKQMNNVASYSQTFFFNPEEVKIMGILG